MVVLPPLCPQTDLLDAREIPLCQTGEGGAEKSKSDAEGGMGEYFSRRRRGKEGG